jgi:hypothetical protein
LLRCRSQTTASHAIGVIQHIVIQHLLRIPLQHALSEDRGDTATMQARLRDTTGAGRPTPSWFAGIMIGLTVSGLATSAMMLGAGLAIGQAMTRPK